MKEFSITVDGCDYSVQEDHEGDVIRVVDATGFRIADAERDHACEDVHFSYFEPESGLIESSCMTDLFQKDNSELARWLVSTHPCT